MYMGAALFMDRPLNCTVFGVAARPALAHGAAVGPGEQTHKDDTFCQISAPCAANSSATVLTVFRFSD